MCFHDDHYQPLGVNHTLRRPQRENACRVRTGAPRMMVRAVKATPETKPTDYPMLRSNATAGPATGHRAYLEGETETSCACPALPRG